MTPRGAKQTVGNGETSTDIDDFQDQIDPQWAWSEYQPDTERPWDLVRVGHLFRRAAFGATWQQLQQAVTDGPKQTIGKLLQPERELAAFNRAYDDYEASADGGDSVDGLRAWWLRRMIETPHPLLEKMTLFWHNHFAISNVRVKIPRLMREHVGLLRRHALGGFQPLLGEVCRDPATLLGMDCEANRKSKPNENYARGLLGTFVLGPGNFTERDVSETARAFTGWFVLRGKTQYIGREHDSGLKRVLDHEGNFTDEDVVRIVLGQPASPRFLVRKLYRWLVAESHEPSESLIQPLADSFGQDYDIGRLAETILRSNLFFSAASYRQKIKSPVEFALGIVTGLESLVPTAELGKRLAELGQNLLNPPTINGWAGGLHWINEATLLGRGNLAYALLSGAEPFGDRLDAWAVARRHGFGTPESAAKFLLDLFLQDDVPPDVATILTQDIEPGSEVVGDDVSVRLGRLTRNIVLLPEFQLN